MGRSVSQLHDATVVCFMHPDFSDPADDTIEESYLEWEQFRDDLIDTLMARFPSLSPPSRDRWEGNEVKIILENGLVEVGLAEYCGVVSLSVRPRQDDRYYSTSGLAERWALQSEKTFETICSAWGGMRRVGRFSNGESLYEKL